MVIYEDVIYSENANINPVTPLTLINQPPRNNLIFNALPIWATRITNIDSNEIIRVLSDSNNNIIVIAAVSNTVDPLEYSYFYNANNIIGTSLSDIGKFDIFISKYSTIGTVMWVNIIKNVSRTTSLAVTIDKTDNIIIAGNYESSAFTGAPPAIGLSLFLTKYDTMGQKIWSTFAVSSSMIRPYGICCDMTNHIILTGQYNGTYTHFFDKTGIVEKTLENSIGYDIFISKYNASGNLTWITRIVGNANNIPSSITTLNDFSIVVTGRFYSDALLLYDAPNGITNSHIELKNTRQQSSDGFLAKYTALGQAVWALKISSDNDVYANVVQSTSDDKIILSGSYFGSVLNLHTTCDRIETLPNTRLNSIYIAKYTSDGLLKWATQVAGIVQYQSLTIDNNDDIILGTTFNTRILDIYNSDGNLGPRIVQPINSDSSSIVIKYNKRGRCLWAARQTSANGYVDICSDNNNNIIICGSYNSGRKFHIYDSNNVESKTLPRSTNRDIFLIKYSDYTQTLTLQAVLAPYDIIKNIVMNSYNGTHTLINTSNLLIDNFNNIIVGIIYTNNNSRIILRWVYNKWLLVSYNDINMIYL